MTWPPVGVKHSHGCGPAGCLLAAPPHHSLEVPGKREHRSGACMGTRSCRRPVSPTGVALRAVAQALWAHRYKVGCTMADESAGRGWPEPAHHLRSTSNTNPRATGLFPAAAGGIWLFPSSRKSQTGRSLSPCPLQGVGKQARKRVASGLSHSKQGHTNAIAPYNECYNGELLLW